MKVIFRALESRNYRLFFFGQMISLLGTWMTSTAALWLVYHLSRSPLILGVAGFCGQVPSFLLAPVAGVWVDRVDRYRLLVATQVLSMLQSSALAFFTLTGRIDVVSLIALGMMQGFINAFDMPVRQALVVEFVEKREHLGNAIALNSFMFNLCRLVGPALAGFVIAAWSAGACFVVDAVSYLAVISSLLAMRLKSGTRVRSRKPPWQDLREGLRYAFVFPPVRGLILLVCMVSFWGFSFSILAPVFAREVFHGDARTLGFLMAGTGLGAMLGALYLGTRHSIRGLGQVIVIGGLLQGGGLIAFPHTTLLPVAVGWTALMGVGGILIVASGNTIVQTPVDDDKRGRVMSLFTMAFTGTMPLGSLIMGMLAHQAGLVMTSTLSGLMVLLATAVFYRRLPAIRAGAHPILERMEAAAALPSVEN